MRKGLCEVDEAPRAHTLLPFKEILSCKAMVMIVNATSILYAPVPLAFPFTSTSRPPLMKPPSPFSDTSAFAEEAEGEIGIGNRLLPLRQSSKERTTAEPEARLCRRGPLSPE